MRKETSKLVVLGSGQGSNFEALADWQTPLFEISGVFSDRECPLLAKAKSRNIPSILLPWKQWFPHPPALEERATYETEAARLIHLYFGEPDLIVLAGYMRLLSSKFLSLFSAPILNVHPANLYLETAEGKRRFIGAHSVFDALKAGEKTTRSSVIQVNEEEDGGPIISLGPEVPYSEGEPITPEKAKIHQEKQKQLSDIPALKEAVTKILSQRKRTCAEFSEPSLESL